jgi:hypothetical protein
MLLCPENVLNLSHLSQICPNSVPRTGNRGHSNKYLQQYNLQRLVLMSAAQIPAFPLKGPTNLP